MDLKGFTCLNKVLRLSLFKNMFRYDAMNINTVFLQTEDPKSCKQQPPATFIKCSNVFTLVDLLIVVVGHDCI